MNSTALQTYDPEQQRLALLEQYNPAEHLIVWQAFNKQKNISETVRFLPANWRLYELQLRYPEAHYDIDIIHMDVERDFCIVRAKLYIGDCYETSPKRAVAHKQGKLTQLDKIETGAKARAARDFGISTEHGLDMEDGQIEGSVISSTVIINEDPPIPDESFNEVSAQETSRLPEASNVKPMVKPKKPANAQPAQDGKLLPSQHNALKMLYLKLNEPIPEDLGEWNFAQAAATITGLQAKLRQAS